MHLHQAIMHGIVFYAAVLFLPSMELEPLASPLNIDSPSSLFPLRWPKPDNNFNPLCTTDDLLHLESPFLYSGSASLDASTALATDLRRVLARDCLKGAVQIAEALVSSQARSKDEAFCLPCSLGLLQATVHSHSKVEPFCCWRVSTLHFSGCPVEGSRRRKNTVCRS